MKRRARRFSGWPPKRTTLLRRRAGQLTAAARGELGMLLERLRAGVLEKRERLLAEEAAIGERQRELSAHLVRVRADVDEAFAEYLAPLEQGPPRRVPRA